MLENTGKYYLYRHIRLDKNEPFYIGIGTKRNRTINIHTTEYERAFTKNRRSKLWTNISNKTDYEVEILLESDDYEFIKQKEIEFIALYQRKDCCNGVLVNLTDGGEGTKGIIPYNKGVKNLTKEQHPNWGKKLSKETCKRKSESMKKSDKSLKGKKLPDWWCEKISNAVKGENNHMSKMVIDTATGIIYSTFAEAYEKTNQQLSKSYINKMLNNQHPNKTTLEYYYGV